MIIKVKHILTLNLFSPSAIAIEVLPRSSLKVPYLQPRSFDAAVAPNEESNFKIETHRRHLYDLFFVLLNLKQNQEKTT